MLKINRKGFTLVELLIVMAIIGILIAVAIVGLGSAQADARNNARQTSVKGIAGLLETYYGTNGQSYPASVETTGTNQDVTFVSSGGSVYSTNSSLCKATIDPLAPGNIPTFNGTSCNGTQVAFVNDSGGGGAGVSNNTGTQYIYVPYVNGQSVGFGITPTSSVTGYLVGACLENSTIFVYTSNGSNAPYTQVSPNVIRFPNGNTYTCN